MEGRFSLRVFLIRRLLGHLLLPALILLGTDVWAGNVKRRDTLMYVHVNEVTSLDPAYPYDALSHALILNIYDTLISFEGSSLERFVPGLATRVPSVENGLISKDGLTYRFPIRKGVFFHDGTELTPEDVRYSLLRFMLQDRAGGPSCLLLEPIMGVESTRDRKGELRIKSKEPGEAVKVDGDSVVVRLKRPFAPFLSIMARWSYVVSKRWASRHGDWDGRRKTWKKYNNPDKEASYFFDHANGTGPFMLERWHRAAKQIVLLRNDRYWRKPAALKRVVMKTMGEFATRRLVVQAGDADIADVPRSFVSQMEGLKGVKVLDDLPRLQTDPVLFFTFRINKTANPDIGSGNLDGEGIPPDFFTDADIRKGFAYSFDYGAFMRDAFRGKVERAKGSIPPGLIGHHPKQPFYTHDLKKAEEHFKKARGGEVWEKGFEFTLTYNTGGELREIACSIIKRNVESISPKFKVNVRGVDWPSFLHKTQRRLMPMFSRGWIADYPDAHNFAFPFFHSKGRYAIAQGYSNPEMDSLVEKALRAVDLEERKRRYFDLQELAYNEALQIYTVHPAGLIVMRDWVKGYLDNPAFMGVYFYPISKE